MKDPKHTNADIEQLLTSAYSATSGLRLRDSTIPWERSRESAWRSRQSDRRWLAPGLSIVGVAATVLIAVALVTNADGDDPREVPPGGAVAASAQTSSPIPTGRAQSESSSPNPSEITTQYLLLSVGNRARKLAAEKDPAFEQYAIDIRSKTVTIYRADSNPDRLASIYSSINTPGVTLKFSKALLAPRQIVHLGQVLDQQRAVLEKRGIHLTGSFEKSPGGPIVIGYSPTGKVPSEADLAPFEIYGKGTVQFQPFVEPVG